MEALKLWTCTTDRPVVLTRLGLCRVSGIHQAHPLQLLVQPRVGWLADSATSDPGQLLLGWRWRWRGRRLPRTRSALGRVVVLHRLHHPSRVSEDTRERGSVAVIVAAIVIAVTGWTQADALASVAIGLLIIGRT